MIDVNENASFACRFLSSNDFPLVLNKFIEAFSDYAYPFDFHDERFRNHIVLNAVDLDRSVGCYSGDKLVGFSLNGFGYWKGKPTVYDAGTGVIPAFRRHGASTAMFEMMVPVFKNGGAEQYLLEVITTNEPAVKLYEKLGFEIQRELLLLEAPGDLKINVRQDDDISIRRINAADLSAYAHFWDETPSWQNSNEAIVRSERLKTVLGAFTGGRCVGYIAFTSGLGRIAQFVVDKEFRGRGIGNRLLAEMQADLVKGSKMQVLNIDKAAEETVQFLLGRGFRSVLSQYEMIMPL